MIAGSLEIQMSAEMARLRQDLAQGRQELASFASAAEKVAATVAAAFGAAFAGITFEKIVAAAEEAEKASSKLDAVVKATGQTAGYTRAQLDQLADAMAELTQFDDESFRNAEASILRFGNVSGQQFERTLKASADLAAFLGTDVPHAAELLAKAMASPAQGVERLQRTIGYLDESQIKAIRTMAEMGDTVGAQNALLDIMEGRLGGVAETMNSGYPKAINDAKKAHNEFLEAVGKTSAVKGVTESFFNFVTGSLRDLKSIVESGDWFDKLMKLNAFAWGFRQDQQKTQLPTPSTFVADPSITQTQIKSMEDALAAHNKWAKEQEEKAAKEREKLRELDMAGWVKYAQSVFDTAEESDRALAAISEAYWAEEQKKRDLDNKGWVAHIEAMTEEYERGLRAIGDMQPSMTETMAAARKKEEQDWQRFWGNVGSFAGNFFADLVAHGRSAFGHLRDYVKQLLTDMVGLFVKRWVLNLAAGGTFLGAAGQALAGGAGGDSIAGGLLNNVGSLYAGATGAYGAATGFYTGYTSAASEAALGASFVGPSASLAGGSVGAGATAQGLMESMGWTGWGVIIAAVVAIVGNWLSNRQGGPKVGGSYYQGGGVPGTDNARFFTPNEGDQQMRDFVDATSTAFTQALASLGGGATNPGFNFGAGFDWDPHGDSKPRISVILTDPSGKPIYDVRDKTLDDEKDIPGALSLESKRMLLAALQASDLPKEVGDILHSVIAAGASSDEIDAVIAKAREMKLVLDALGTMEWGHLTVDALKAMALEGETISQTFTRIAGQMGAFDDAFLTDAQKLDRAKAHVADVFGELGMAVPKTTADLVKFVHGLDLTSEAGQKAWKLLMSVFPDLQTLFKPDGTPESFTSSIQQATHSVNEFSDSLRNPRADLGDWLNKLTMDPNLTTLSLDERFAQAKKDFDRATRLGRAGDIQSSGQDYLELAKQKYGQDSPEYAAIFQALYAAAGNVAIGEKSFQEVFSAAVPKNSQIASASDIASVNRMLVRVAQAIDASGQLVAGEVKGARRDAKDKSVKPFGAG